MFSPKYRILISSKHFPRDGVIGLGTQLISIINSIKNYLPPHVWFGSDVEAVGKGANKYSLNSSQLRVIGNDLQLIQYCNGIEQFIWGVFLCVEKKFSSQNIQDVELETEDESFRSINANGILMEIRAFDTTYFGIYTENIELITKLSKQHNVEIEKTKEKKI